MSLAAQIEEFSRASLRNVTTRVTTPEGKQILEDKGVDGSTRTQEAGFTKFGFCPDFEPDLQVGQPLRHLFISSQDVAQSLEMLQAMGITHILNVATGVANAFPEVFVLKS
jgi:hypothetical protein